MSWDTPNYALPGLMPVTSTKADSVIPPILIIKGATFSEVWSVPIAEGDPDLVGFTATADVYECADAEPVFQITCEITDPLAASITLSMTDEETTELTVGDYFTSIKLESPGGTVEYLVRNNRVLVTN